METIENLRKKYENRLRKYKNGYEAIAKIIGYTILKMKQRGQITGEAKITGRLKSFKSVEENYKNKSIDDCFGIRVIAENDSDLQKIKAELEKIFIVEKTKDHRKKQGTKYNGIHEIVQMNPAYIERMRGIGIEECPKIEIQYWNEDLEKKCINGELAYSKYKNRDIEQILETYRKRPYQLYSNLPTYYEIRGNKIRMLSAEETLRRVYPEIEDFMKKNNNREDEIESESREII